MATAGERLLNWVASAYWIAFTCGLCLVAPHFDSLLGRSYQLGIDLAGADLLLASALLYSLALLVHYLTEDRPDAAKARLAWRALKQLRGGVRNLGPAERLGLLATLLKMYFAPLMLMWLLGHVESIGLTAAALRAYAFDPSISALDLFNGPVSRLLLQVLILVDVFFFTIGYVIELPRLRSTIRSVDPTLLGWAAALLCYPPFNQVTSAILGWQSSDFPRFEQSAVHLGANLLIIALMSVYAAASVALNFKASNLTHRGIVGRGPYAWVRHPAYVAKNLAWWIAAWPAFAHALSISAWDALNVLASVAGWSALYVLRALTEEDHLRSVDGEYAAYAARVRYRFIPGIV